MEFRDNHEMPGHLARRFQQIAVAIFHAEISAAGFDLTPVQYAALAAIYRNPCIDHATLSGLIAYDRTSITGVIDRLVQKELILSRVHPRDRRAREVAISDGGRKVLRDIIPAVEAAQTKLLRGLEPDEAVIFMRLMKKAINACNELSRAPLRVEGG